MKIGDLVRYKPTGWEQYIGIIIRCIPGINKVKIVQWITGEYTGTGTHSEQELEIVK
jgi:hypothetical protein|tara:strand:+ start:292 stop:462 length:171 start_codon:yes stop_codon:yes gene_type:complete